MPGVSATSRSIPIILGIPACFTLLVVWFAWSTLRAAQPIAAENLRGAGLSVSAAIEQLAAADSSFTSLARYSTPDIAYFALVDRQGIFRFHTNPHLIGQPYRHTAHEPLPGVVAEQRETLGTGEEVYLLRTSIHPHHDEYLLLLALHTYRADQVIRRARTGVTFVALLTVPLWGLTVVLLFMQRREERHHREMHRREELARLGELGAVMAHEIRTPLAGIKGFAQLVESATGIEQARLYAARIVSQSNRIERLVNNLLAYARDDQGERRETDLALLIEDCVSQLQQEAADQRVTIEVTLPPYHVRATTVADHIVQLLLNLIKNAIQAMPDGGTLAIQLGQRHDTACITVSDNGIGIPAEHLPHIFEPFWTSKANGTGLGLALCRKVADEHGGSLTVESAPGIGTTFTAILPGAQKRNIHVSNHTGSRR